MRVAFSKNIIVFNDTMIISKTSHKVKYIHNLSLIAKVFYSLNCVFKQKHTPHIVNMVYCFEN